METVLVKNPPNKEPWESGLDATITNDESGDVLAEGITSEGCVTVFYLHKGFLLLDRFFY